MKQSRVFNLDPDLSRLIRRFNLALPRPCDTWRSVKDKPYGQIHGLPDFRGQAVATNGIVVAILTNDNKILFGHLQWFTADEPEKNVEPARLTAAKTKNYRQLDYLLQL